MPTALAQNQAAWHTHQRLQTALTAQLPTRPDEPSVAHSYKFPFRKHGPKASTLVPLVSQLTHHDGQHTTRPLWTRLSQRGHFREKAGTCRRSACTWRYLPEAVLAVRDEDTERHRDNTTRLARHESGLVKRHLQSVDEWHPVTSVFCRQN